MELNSEKPILVEPTVRVFLQNLLHDCRHFQEQYYNLVWNIGMGVALFGVVSMILYIKYKGKPNEEELAYKDYERQKYIMERIHNFKEAKQREEACLITGLPYWQYTNAFY